MTQLDLREHCLVDVKCLIDYLDLFSGLLLVPLFKFAKEFLVDIVSPVIDLQYVVAFVGASDQKDGCDDG